MIIHGCNNDNNLNNSIKDIKSNEPNFKNIILLFY